MRGCCLSHHGYRQSAAHRLHRSAQCKKPLTLTPTALPSSPINHTTTAHHHHRVRFDTAALRPCRSSCCGSGAVHEATTAIRSADSSRADDVVVLCNARNAVSVVVSSTRASFRIGYPSLPFEPIRLQRAWPSQRMMRCFGCGLRLCTAPAIPCFHHSLLSVPQLTLLSLPLFLCVL